MKTYDVIISAALIVALVACVASFTMPTLLGRPIVPQIMQTAAPQLPTQTITPADVTAQAADEAFSLRVSGNVYYDKLPVQGAEVTIYLNGRQVGRTTAGDIYMFDVPGVRTGDTIRVDAAYQGTTGTASEVVKFKSMSLNVQIKSGHSFIRDALGMLPSQDDITKSQQEQASQPAAQTPAASTPAASSATTSSADANQLTSQIFGNTANQLTNMISGSNNALADPTALTAPAAAAGNMNINDIQNTINAGGLSGLSI
jgi:hypothetical protein